MAKRTLKTVRRSGKNFFFDLKKRKRISKKEFSRRLKISNALTARPARKRKVKPRKKKLVKKPFKSGLSRGFDTTKRTRLLFTDTEIKPKLNERLSSLFFKSIERIKRKDKFVFFQIAITLIFDEEDQDRRIFIAPINLEQVEENFQGTVTPELNREIDKWLARLGERFYDLGDLIDVLATLLKVSIRFTG